MNNLIKDVIARLEMNLHEKIDWVDYYSKQINKYEEEIIALKHQINELRNIK